MKRLFLVCIYALSLHSQEISHSILYAPWRDAYINARPTFEQKEACPFCRAKDNPLNKEEFVLGVFKYNLVMLNAFPYAKGHILITPFEHKGRLQDISPEARAEMMELASLSLEIIEKVYGTRDANVGFNIGRMAGAGIPDHLHMHVVPRAIVPSFMALIGNTEVVNFDMNQVYRELKAMFEVITCQN